MAHYKNHPNGSFCWAELKTHNLEGTKTFYNKLFDWKAKSIPMSDGEDYKMFLHKGEEICGFYKLKNYLQSKNTSPYWQPYVSVESVDTIAKGVEKFGGKAMMEPFDVSDSGRMTFIQDPDNASLGIWQPKNGIGTKYKNEFNTICWVELATNKIEESINFYGNLFGWISTVSNFGTVQYFTFKNGDIPEAGMYKKPIEQDAIPSHWLIYFCVEDCTKTVEIARKNGANIIKEPENIPTVGTFAIIQDPYGAVFGIIRLEM